MDSGCRYISTGDRPVNCDRVANFDTRDRCGSRLAARHCGVRRIDGIGRTRLAVGDSDGVTGNCGDFSPSLLAESSYDEHFGSLSLHCVVGVTDAASADAMPVKAKTLATDPARRTALRIGIVSLFFILICLI